MQAFRRLYEQVGLGWIYAITKYEPVSPFIPHEITLVLLVYFLQNYAYLKETLFVFSILYILLTKHLLQIATVADAVYGVWAKYRLQITGKFIQLTKISHRFLVLDLLHQKKIQFGPLLFPPSYYSLKNSEIASVPDQTDASMKFFQLLNAMASFGLGRPPLEEILEARRKNKVGTRNTATSNFLCFLYSTS